ncbi:ExbD/TolR family protein [Halanaerobium praevalens]|uniref:Biopolymer transport protein ExbD/TolR n=1 Tax=Halanaerobium praevalens (strain ATCC 33744 / DSM 2228 / GSL) TaxID=572479 RepID=E3DRP5_HALPG|nr:biopolymer transporter ExbD [Halanaerobium praevalens]ADO77086.1 Biopolymer transport protein ExbD/TolR [Halanaerobium praevalens DSM 2228]
MKYQPKKRDSALNLAPMIDIVFLLLIFFLVSSTLQGEESLYKITVPNSNLGQSAAEQRISVFLDKNNKIYFQEKEYKKEQIKQLFAVIPAAKDNKIKIYADQKSNFEAIVFLIEEFKERDYKNISFALREKN